MQIGANDGVMADPLCEYIKKYNWSGIMVEPVPHLYERLKKNHEARDNLTFRNVAISKDGSSMKFYSEREDKPTRQGSGLSSFSKDHILKFARPERARMLKTEFNKYFKEEEIKTITFDSLVEGVDYIDLLHIDVEGYDLEIIKSNDFNKIIPSVILYEYNNLGKNNGMDYLGDLGYTCEKINRCDVLATHEALQKLTNNNF